VSAVNLADIFGGLANRWSDRKAIVSPRLSLSYDELVGRAAQSARELRLRGIGGGARVGICIRDGAETVVLMLAIWMVRATVIAIDFRTSGAERALLASEFDMAAILEDRQTPAAGYDSMLIDPSWADTIARHDRSPLWTSYQEPVPAVISLTSGTTDRPIGVVLDHEQVLLQAIFDLSQRFGTSLLNPLPLWFAGSRNHTFGALLRGSVVCFHPMLFSTEELTEAILGSKATSVCAVPTIIRSMLEIAGEQSSPLFEGLDALYCFGAPMLPEEKLKAKKVLCSNFSEGYGSNICGRMSTLCGLDLEARPDTVGRVLPFVVLQIVDDNDRVLPLGETGTIRVRSPGVARAIYGGRTRASGDKLKDGWAYPGDIAALDGEGFLRLLGRTSGLIIRGGANVHPAEVEAVLADYPGVKEVSVVGFAQAREGEEIAAFVVGATDLTEANLVAHCRARLSPDKRPRRYIFVTELPRTSNGNVSRAKLRERLETAV
jgi:long-chain acyl-CoA synthetase